MSKLLVAIGVSLLAGFAVAALFIGGDDADTPVLAEAGGFDANADVDARLRALEAAVNAEREARQLLEEELLVLYEELDALNGPSGERNALLEADQIDAETLRQLEREQRRQQARAERNQQSENERRRENLIAGGFSPTRADWIIQREGELRMEIMQERYEAMRSGEAFDPRRFGSSPEARLRADLGDTEYENYLQAHNWPTAVGVGSVFESSPAQTAGLLPGDEITHYDGRRVFNTFDLTQQTMEGESGENVVVNITRDGMPMQVVLPRGPLGINTGRRR